MGKLGQPDGTMIITFGKYAGQIQPQQMPNQKAYGDWKKVWDLCDEINLVLRPPVDYNDLVEAGQISDKIKKIAISKCQEAMKGK